MSMELSTIKNENIKEQQYQGYATTPYEVVRRKQIQENGYSNLLDLNNQGIEPTQPTQPQKSKEEQLLDMARAEQERLWDREDKIRKETQAREDNAYQRAVADMLKAGINPAVFDVNPAKSGGGITNATAQDWTLVEQQIQQEFEKEQNAKDRVLKIFQIIGTILTGGMIAKSTKKK